MSDRLRSMITLHETIVGAKLPSHHVKSCIEGLQVVQYILQTTIRKDIIVESFKITGQYDPVAGGCSIDRILGQCKEEFTAQEVKQVHNALPQLCTLMKESGKLKEMDYEVLSFEQGDHYHGDRDSLVLNRRRYLFLTNLAVIASEDAERVAKITAADLRKESALKRKDAAAARLAAGVVPRRRAKKNAVVKPLLNPLLNQLVSYTVDTCFYRYIVTFKNEISSEKFLEKMKHHQVEPIWEDSGVKSCYVSFKRPSRDFHDSIFCYQVDKLFWMTPLKC